MKSMAFIFCLEAVLVAVSIPAGHARTVHTNDENLTDKVCKIARNYSQCVQLLRSDPQNSTANLTGLALFTVRAIESNATQTLVKINQLLHGSPDPKQKKALENCVTQYLTIISSDVASANQGLQMGFPKIAEEGVEGACVSANRCEGNFSGNPPLTQQNKVICDDADVAEIEYVAAHFRTALHI